MLTVTKDSSSTRQSWQRRGRWHQVSKAQESLQIIVDASSAGHRPYVDSDGRIHFIMLVRNDIQTVLEQYQLKVSLSAAVHYIPLHEYTHHNLFTNPSLEHLQSLMTSVIHGTRCNAIQA